MTVRKKATPVVSVVIVNWNTCQLVIDCLESLFQDASAVTMEIFVVDNASSDGSQKTIKAHYPQIILIENQENIGFARANNQAIREIQHPYILLLNSDTRVTRGAISGMIAFLEQNKDVGIVGPALLDAEGNVQLSWATFPTLWSEIRGKHYRRRQPYGSHDTHAWAEAYEVDWLAGACILVRRQAIDDVGLMDERFFLYSEETDWCLRIHSAGWRNVYFPKVQVYHFEGSSSGKDASHTKLLLYHSKILFQQKHYGTIPAIALQFYLITRSLTKATLMLLKGQLAIAYDSLQISTKLLFLNRYHQR